MKTSIALLAACTLAASASAQLKGVPTPKTDVGGYFPPQGGSTALVVGGSNDCSTASTSDALTGPGTYSVTTVGATNGTPDAAGCVNTQLDVWFYWTANCSGDVTVATCGGVTADSVITVWADGATPGTCPTTSLACNDDFCGLQSSVTFPAVNGTSYFFQLGAFGAATTYSGTFSVSACVAPPVVPPNDDCGTPVVIAGPGSFPFDNRLATTGTQGQTEGICLFFGTTAIQKDAWWTWTPTLGGTATLTTCGTVLPAGGDTKVSIYDGAGCPVAASIACNDDDATCTAGGLNSTVTWNTVCGQTYTIQLGNFSVAASLSGTFAITETGTPCGPSVTPYCFGDGTSTACPCGNTGAAGNGCASSVNPLGGNLSSTGNPSIGSDTLVLVGTGMPNASCLYFQGTTQIATVFGDGLRCAGGSVIRLGTKTNAGGGSQYPQGGDLSISVRGSNTVGDARTYQAWYRNAAAFCTPSTFNLTNGLALTWAP